MDDVKLEKAALYILEGLGRNPKDAGVVDTPKRFVKMCREVFAGMDYTNKELANMYDKCFDCDNNGLVVESRIPVFSYCEHHLALMYDMYVSVGYIPQGRVIGLSKIARIADMCAKRLQLQERIGQDIFEVLSSILNTEDIIIVIEGKHACMTTRGIKKPESITRTALCKGRFEANTDLRREFYSLIEK